MYGNMSRMSDEKLLTQTTQTHSTHEATHKEPRPSLYSSILAIVGFIILIVIVLWGLIHIVTLASPWFASFFNTKTSTSTQVTAPASATTSKQAQGSATVAVLPSSPITVISLEPATQIKPTAPRASGPADLSVRIIAVNTDQSGMTTVEFGITNEGESSSGTYYFEAFLPTQSAYTYTSPLQSSLGQGEHIVNILRFTQAVLGTVSIVVDPSRAVHESNENNNYASQSVSMPYYTQPYPYQQYLQPYVY